MRLFLGFALISLSALFAQVDTGTITGTITDASGAAVPNALTGGFEHALVVLGAIGLLAVPAVLALVRRQELAAVSEPTRGPQPKPALAPAN